MTEQDKVKKIYINGRFLTQSVTGVQRYAIEVVKALDSLIDNGEIDLHRYQFTLLAPLSTTSHLELKHIPLKHVGFLKGHLWEQLELPLYTYGGLLMCLCNAGPLLKRNQVVTIHDAAVFGFPQAFSSAFRTWYRLLLTGLGRVTQKVITDSAFSAQELIKYTAINPAKLKVIPLGREHILNVRPDWQILDRHGLTGKRFILALSSLSPHKNFKALVEAIRYLDGYCIVIAGGTNPKVFGTSQSHLPDNVKHIGYVTDNEVRVLYEKAACFVYPSFYEGFGLPPLEAMTCGCPVVVSDAASLPEVCGDAALYCNPGDPVDIAAKIRSVVDNPDLREEMRQKGFDRAAQFTWENCARGSFKILESLSPIMGFAETKRSEEL